MNNYKNWPDGAVAIVFRKEDGVMRFVNADGFILNNGAWIDSSMIEYKTTIATRELEPESKGYQLGDVSNTKHLEFMHACYQRGLSYSDAVDLWELK